MLPGVQQPCGQLPPAHQAECGISEPELLLLARPRMLRYHCEVHQPRQPAPPPHQHFRKAPGGAPGCTEKTAACVRHHQKCAGVSDIAGQDSKGSGDDERCARSDHSGEEPACAGTDDDHALLGSDQFL